MSSFHKMHFCVCPFKNKTKSFLLSFSPVDEHWSKWTRTWPVYYLCWFPGGIVTLGCPVNFCTYTSGKHYQKCVSYIITCIYMLMTIIAHKNTNVTHVGCCSYLIFSTNAQLCVKVWRNPARRCQYPLEVSTNTPLTSLALLTFTQWSQMCQNHCINTNHTVIYAESTSLMCHVIQWNISILMLSSQSIRTTGHTWWSLIQVRAQFFFCSI